MSTTNNLSHAIAQMAKVIKIPPYLLEIFDGVQSGQASKSRIQSILNNYNIHENIAKVEALHFLIAYIKWAISDDDLTEEEIENIKLIKNAVNIQPGDFYIHNKREIEQVIAIQLEKIYKDNNITEHEAIYKIKLQEIFDLTFDQMNDYSKSEAIRAIRQGANPVDLDIFLSYNEYFKSRPD